MSGVAVLPGLTPAEAPRHVLHGESAAWPEKNCYVDLWIGLLHALGLQPLAGLGFTVAVDFEGDQWTFFKPPACDLRLLYGIDVQELTVWRPLLAHAREHLGAGRLIAAEVDAWWLPDTAATDYHRGHTKTTILLNALDLEAQRLGYFHNSGYHVLEGEDFRGLFRLGEAPDPAMLPLFAELVKIDRRVQHSETALMGLALDLLRSHTSWRPRRNPFGPFATRLAQDLPGLQAQGLARYHAWAFASVRQAGAAFELTGAHLRWLESMGSHSWADAAADFDAIGHGLKALILKGARAVHSDRPLDASALLGDLATRWEAGMAKLEAGLRTA